MIPKYYGDIISDMTESGFHMDMIRAFDEWRKNPSKEQGTKLLAQIKFAFENGIDLRLKVPRSIVSGDVPLLSRNEMMIMFDEVEESNFVFNIPSKKTTEAIRMGRVYSLDVQAPMVGYQVVLLKNGQPVINFDKDNITSIVPA